MEKIKFSDLKINKFVLRALDEMGFEHPTTIQEKVFSDIKAGKDVVGIAQTGTGKTFAYLIPLLSLWKYTKSLYPQILIIVPTRELVAQVVTEVEKLSQFLNLEVTGVYGGTNMNTHRLEVSQKLDVIVGTPGRLMDLMLEGTLQTKDITRLVIDEVDEMLNLGFRTQLKNIVDLIPAKRQNLMFSATLIPEVEFVIDQFTHFYEKIEAAPSGAPLENIEQYAYELPNFNSKANMLNYLLETDQDLEKVLVFASTRKMADALYERMNESFEDEVGVLHSSKSQNNRFDTVNKFEDGTYRFIIATDIVARGLDIENVSHVINFDLNNAAEQYIHRIGRTGRAENKGKAISFVSETDQKLKENIETLMSQKIKVLEVPAEVEISTELIELETEKDHLASDNFYKVDAANAAAFHDKKAKNKKVNNKIRHKDLMMKKYGKKKTRGAKPKGKKK